MTSVSSSSSSLASFSSPLSPSLMSLSPTPTLPGSVPGAEWGELEGVTESSAFLSLSDHTNLNDPQPRRGSLIALAKLRRVHFKGIDMTPDKDEKKAERKIEAEQILPLDKRIDKPVKSEREVKKIERIIEAEQILPLDRELVKKDRQAIYRTKSAENLALHNQAQFERAQENLDSNSLEVLKINLELLFDRKSYSDAEKLAQLILKSKPGDVDATKYMGAICLQYSVDKTKEEFDRVDKAKQARKLLFAALRKAPKDKFTLLFLARLHNLNQNYTDALILADPLLREYPLDLQVLLVKATILINLNRLSEAKRILAKIKKSDRNEEYEELLKQIAEKKRKTNQASQCSCIIC